MAEPRGESGSLFAWLVPTSVLAHVVVVALMPNARGHAPIARPVLVVEMTAAPPEPPPDPPAPAPTPTSAAPAIRDPLPSRPLASTSAPRPSSTTEPEAKAGDDAPVDFTSTTFSGEGSGVAIGGPGSRAVGPSVARPSARPSVEPPRFVPVGSLARAPSAPGLDAELERNYPSEARRSGISGTAVLRVQILPDGRVGRVDRVSESFAGFGDACSRTVRAGKWQAPIDRDGRAVSTQITYTCRFEVRS